FYDPLSGTLSRLHHCLQGGFVHADIAELSVSGMEQDIKRLLCSPGHFSRKPGELFVLHDPHHFLSSDRTAVIENIQVLSPCTDSFHGRLQIMVQPGAGQHVEDAHIRRHIADHLPCLFFLTAKDRLHSAVRRSVSPSSVEQKLQGLLRRAASEKLFDHSIGQKRRLKGTYACDRVSIFCIAQNQPSLPALFYPNSILFT